MQLAVAAVLAGLAQRAGRLAASFTLGFSVNSVLAQLSTPLAGCPQGPDHQGGTHPSVDCWLCTAAFHAPSAPAVLHLQATRKGLTSEEAAKRLVEYGPNKLPEETRNPFLVYLGVREI